MPYLVRKIRNKNLYKVINRDTGEIHSHGSTKANATKQVRLLHMIENKKGNGIGLDDNKDEYGENYEYPKLQASLVGDGFYRSFK